MWQQDTIKLHAAAGQKEGDKLSISKEQQLDKETHRNAMSEMKSSKKAKQWFNRKPYSIKGSDTNATNRKTNDGE